MVLMYFRAVGVSIITFLFFIKHYYSSDSFLERDQMLVVFTPSSLLCMELNALKISANNSVASRFFVYTPSIIQRIEFAKLWIDFSESRSDFSQGNFKSDTIVKQRIINLCKYSSKSYAFVLLCYS